MKKQTIHFNLRLSKDLHEKLLELSKEENRSLHGQIMHFVQKGLGSAQKKK